MGIAHQHDGIGNGSRTANHGDAQWGYGDVVGIVLHLIGVDLGMRITCLQHVIADLKDDDAAGNAESVGGYAEEHEDELSGKGEYDEDNKRRDGSSFDDGLALLFAHALCHREEHRHGAKWIGKCEDGGEA